MSALMVEKILWRRHKVALGGIANRLDLGFGDIHIKSPDPSIVVKEI